MRRSIGIGVLVGALGLAVLASLAARAGWLDVAVPRADGPWPWLLGRATGVTAYVSLTLEATLGLLVSTGAADRFVARARTVELHRWLSGVGLGLVGAHALLFTVDHVARFDALDVLVPFLSEVRPLGVGLGVLAAYLAVVLHVSFALRGRLGARTWRRLHHASFALFALATVHGVLAGTDAGEPWLRAILVGSVAVVLALVGVRLGWTPVSASAARDAGAR